MIDARIKIDPSIVATFHKCGNPKELVKFLKKTVRDRAAPTLTAVYEKTPFRSGQLQQSIGLTMKTDSSNGEVYATIGVKDNVTLFVGGRKMLSSSLKAVNAAKKAARLGISLVTQRTAFKYVFGIETGHTRKGRIARKAGGAFMFRDALNQSRQPYIDGVSKDLFDFIRSKSGTVQL
jgi:hypothetical protein